MDSMQTFGSWQIILLENDKVGNDGDVLTRVGDNDAEFKPGAGGGSSAWGGITGTLANQTDLQAALDAAGGNPFDQDLNTTDDPTFDGLTLTGALNVAGGDSINLGDASIQFDVGDNSLEVFSPGTFEVTAATLIKLSGPVRANVFQLGSQFSAFPGNQGALASAYALNVLVGRDALDANDIPLLSWGDGSGMLAADSFQIGGTNVDLNPTDILYINGTPGVTDAAVVVDGVTLSFTKGILTGVA